MASILEYSYNIATNAPIIYFGDTSMIIMAKRMMVIIHNTYNKEI